MIAVGAGLVASLLTGCGGSSDGSTGGTTSGRTATSVTSSGPVAAVVAGDADNGRTLRLHGGQKLRIILGSSQQAGSTSWTFAPIRSGVVEQSGAAQVQRSSTGSSCGIPGAGCGTVTLTATAASPGTVVIIARRSSCGEAMRCRPGQDAFRLTVIVSS
jgi:predicted secreted protein